MQPQHCPPLHTPALPLIVQAVLSGWLLRPQAPSHVGFLHTAPEQVTHAPPPVPHCATVLPA
jgi:hypothetical protein